MASLKAIKLRIKSAKSTQKITKAMKMVAAAKLRRIRDRAEAAEVYAAKMRNVVGDMASHVEASINLPLLSGNGKNDTYLLIAAVSDRGLCGSFNSSILKAVRHKAEELILDGKTVKIICVGKKAYDQLRAKFKDHIIKRFEGISKKTVAYADAEEIADFVISSFAAGEFDNCILFYNKFISTISQKVTKLQLIPAMAENDGSSKGDNQLYEYEPKAEKILSELLPLNIKTQIYQALLENAASEQGARVTAMDNANRSAGDMIAKLTLLYNRSRQAVITKELIEIISGAEAL